ncbi:MAG: hypothetical protein KatS3mg031_1347 [Chitinophagales bacterium]|nr:MAG: hypothetical protein KatS3mg031_1347 [Chitinophagales bacterium]
MAKKMYYSDYLRLNKILHAQYPVSARSKKPAHDEMLFIITHQVYELWFKQILHELKSVRKIFSNPINDNSPAMPIAVHRLKRVVTILSVAVEQINIMETMTPLDFLDFRNMLRPASGFQSYQFKIIEAMLGLRMQDRYMGSYYTAQLKPQHIRLIRQAERQKSLLELVGQWLERMPFFDARFWPGVMQEDDPAAHVFWKKYKAAYKKSLIPEEKGNLTLFNQTFFDDSTQPRRLSPRACRSALFIMLYRDYPLLQHPFQLLNTLLDIDSMLAAWRYRHMHMVHRMIGTRVGTGGSSGRDYLRAALDSHVIFAELAALSTFLIERTRLPRLHPQLERHLGFVKS